MSLPAPLQQIHPRNNERSTSVTISVDGPDGPILVEADVTHSQARRVIDYARALREAAGRRPPLSRRERQVLDCLATGLSYKQVAAELEISIDTVRTYVRALYRKLGAHSVTEAIARARELALV